MSLLTPILMELHQLPISVQAQFKVLSHKALMAQDPSTSRTASPRMTQPRHIIHYRRLFSMCPLQGRCRVGDMRTGLSSSGSPFTECTPQESIPGAVCILGARQKHLIYLGL